MLNAYHIFARRNEGYILTANKKKDALNELSHLSHLFLLRILMKMSPHPSLTIFRSASLVRVNRATRPFPLMNLCMSMIACFNNLINHAC